MFAACTHPVLSGPGGGAHLQVADFGSGGHRFGAAFAEARAEVGKIKVLSVAELLARGIRSIHEETSISELFDLRSCSSARRRAK